jgi:hypothetical protein
MRYSLRRAVVLGFGMLLLAGAAARCEEGSDSREQIIQGVRDDVRRKIQERNETPADNRADRDASKQQPAIAPAHGDTKQEKQDTPK